jgi:hypothetical protein
MRFGKHKTHVRRSERTGEEQKMNENTVTEGEQQ